ncbi:MAG: T9SS type A sorting domain-containing protein [Flavobacteriales bacterium]|nr:T9SS type A sorting domain-containing protein [Flavobacteriales bacterium]
MRCIQYAIGFILSFQATAQQVDWLTAAPVGFSLNPAMPDQALASAPGRLVAMRTVSNSLIYGQTLYGEVALDALDPVTGGVLLSCLLGDSVSVGAAAVDAAGIAYFTGRFMGDVLEFCDGTQLAGIGGDPFTENHFLLAWDLTSGSALWMRNLSISYPAAADVPSLALDPDGSLWYVLQDFFDGRAVRVDAMGNDAEVRDISGIRRFGTISFDPWGGLYMSGSCENGTLSFGGQDFPVESDEGYNMFVLRYKPDGTAGFAEFADDVTFTNPTVVAATDGHAYIAGDLFLQGTDWGGITFNGPNWVYDVFIAKLDSTGQFLWGLQSAPTGGGINGDMHRAKGPCVAVDANDNPYLFGTLRGVIDWGNGVVSNGLTLGAQTMSVVAFAQDGTPQWAATSTPGPYQESQTITALAETDALHFAGHINGTLTFGAHTVNAGGQQAAVVGRIGDLSTGIAHAPEAPALLSCPNPAHTVCTIHAASAQSAQLLDGGGQIVRSIRLTAGANVLSLSGLAPGIYLLRSKDGGVTKLTVE